MNQDKTLSSTTDPLREKLKAWQESRGRLKEKKLPWQPRFRKTLSEITNEATAKTGSPEKCERLESKPPLKPEKKMLPPRKWNDRRTNLENRKNGPEKGECLESKAPLKLETKLSAPQKGDDMRTNLENWKKMKFRKADKENVKVDEPKPKMKVKEPVKSKIPPVAPPAIRKSPINFIERNKKFIQQMQRKKENQKIFRRITVADVHIRMRRSSLEKARRHMNRSTNDYYCLKPRVSIRLANSVKKRKKAPETEKGDDEFVLHGGVELLNAIQLSPRRKSIQQHQRRTASPDFKEEGLDRHQLSSTPSTENYNFNLPPLPPSSRKIRKKLDVQFDEVTMSFNNNIANTVASTPISEIGEEASNFHVKFLVSPIKHLPTKNLYSLTPVRRSIRSSRKSKGGNVFDDLSDIPSPLMSNALYRENSALDIL